MKPDARHSRSVHRGYLLAEALVAAAVLSTMLAAVLDHLSMSRAQITSSARRTVAMNLARGKVDALMSGDPATVLGNTNPSGFSTFDPVPGYQGYRWKWRVRTSGLESASSPALAQPAALLRVEVEVEVKEPLRTRIVRNERLWAHRK